jgi:DNA repair protein RadC
MIRFYVNNHGEKMQNINHQEINNEGALFQKIIESKDAFIQFLQEQLKQLTHEITAHIFINTLNNHSLKPLFNHPS